VSSSAVTAPEPLDEGLEHPDRLRSNPMFRLAVFSVYVTAFILWTQNVWLAAYLIGFLAIDVVLTLRARRAAEAAA
jgi:hypothetical protein